MRRETNGRVPRRRDSLTVVVSTYEWPDALDVVLRALWEQSDPDFSIVVAEDGSNPDTEQVVGRWRKTLGSRLAHVMQADQGFRAARVRNLGALACASDVLVFLDGDCVPRRNFVRAARSCARPGWFGIGRRLHISPELTARVLREGIPIHRWRSPRWLPEWRRGIEVAALTARDRRKVGRLGVPEFVPHESAYSPVLVATTDFELVNGYDMRYEGWGEEDVDLAVRLRRIGLRCGHTGASGTVIHLWHQPRVKRERPNWWRLREVERSSTYTAPVGLRELEQELVGDRARTLATAE